MFLYFLLFCLFLEDFKEQVSNVLKIRNTSVKKPPILRNIQYLEFTSVPYKTMLSVLREKVLQDKKNHEKSGLTF